MRSGWGITVGLGVCLALSSVAKADVKEGERAPELKGVKTAEGKKARIGKFRGRVVVITFGASWCAPCKKELPALGRMAANYHKKRSSAVFIAINTDEDEADGKAFMKGFDLGCVKKGYDTNQKTVGIYNPKTQPSTYIIDKKGIVRHIHTGYHDGDDKKIAAWVDKLDR